MFNRNTKEHAAELAKWAGFTGSEWDWETFPASRFCSGELAVTQVKESYVVMVADSDDNDGNQQPFYVTICSKHGIKRAAGAETKEKIIPTIEHLKKVCGIILKRKNGEE